MHDYPLFLLFIASTILQIGIAVYGWRHRRFPGAAAFSVAMFLFAILPMMEAVNESTSSLIVKVIALKIRAEAAGIGATAWFVMMMQLTGYSHLVNRRLLLGLAVVPFLITIMNWTENPLFRSGYYLDSVGMLHWSMGPVFWSALAYLNLLLLTPLYLLWHSYRRVSPLSVNQTLALSLSVILPLLINVLIQFDIISIPAINFPFAAGPLMGFIVIWAVFRYHLFDLVPFARGLLIESMSDGVLVLDSQGRIVDINPAMRQLVGPIAIGQTADSAFAAWPHLLTRFREVTEARTEIMIDENPPQYFDLRISALSDRDKRLSGRLIVVRDITSHKQTEAALRASENNLRRMLESAPDAMLIVDERGRITFANVQCERIFGYPHAELVGQPVEILLPERFHENHKIHRTDYFDGPRARPMGEGRGLQLAGKRKDNTEFPVEISLSPLEIDEGILVTAAVRDITERKRAEKDLHHKNEYLEALHRITIDLLNQRSKDELLQSIVDQAAQLLAAPFSEVMLLEGDELVVRAFTRNQPFLAGDRVKRGDAHLTWQAFDTQKPVIVSDYAQWPLRRAIYENVKIGAVVALPILVGGRSIGVLDLSKSIPDEGFEDSEIEAATLFAQLAGLTFNNALLQANAQHEIVERKHTEEILRRQNGYLASLHQITLDLLNQRQIDELLQYIVIQASDFLDAPLCAITLKEGEELVIRALTPGQPTRVGDRLGRNEAHLTWQAFDARLPAVVNDYSHWPHRRDIYEHLSLGAVVALPILAGGKSVGVLDLSRSDSGKTFDDSEIQAATLFAELAALALDNAQLHEALRQESIRDPLTNLFNRRFMEETLAKELSLARRNSLPLTVVMFDFDHLKEINDILGHDAGDEALVKLSQLIRGKIRVGDTACRYGGDEFILILPGVSLNEALLRMEEFRQEIKEMNIQRNDKAINPPTTSIGIAEYPRHGETEMELIKAADIALYRAKQAGRDRIEIASAQGGGKV